VSVVACCSLLLLYCRSLGFHLLLFDSQFVASARLSPSNSSSIPHQRTKLKRTSTKDSRDPTPSLPELFFFSPNGR